MSVTVQPYSRKALPLEVRGISRGALEGHPLPDAVGSSGAPTPPPRQFIMRTPRISSEDLADAGTPTSDVDESPLTSRTASPAFGAPGVHHGGWDLGNQTERSSISSTSSLSGVDEYEKLASWKVRQLFDNINQMLFEGIESPRSQPVFSECRDWNRAFPHLRVLGRQVLKEQCEGYSLTPGPSSSSHPSTSSQLLDVDDHDISASDALSSRESGSSTALTISGVELRARRAPKELTSPRDDGHGSPWVEEIFAHDGHYEEVIAIDNSGSDDGGERKQRSQRRQQSGYPPITPNASVENAVESTSFDEVWVEVVAWMRGLNQQLSHHYDVDDRGLDKEEDSGMGQVAMLTPLSPSLSRENTNLSIRPSRAENLRLHTANTCSHQELQDLLGRHHGNLPPMAPRQALHDNQKFDGLLNIKSYNRPDRSDYDEKGAANPRPTSSNPSVMKGGQRPGSVRVGGNDFTGGRLSSARNNGRFRPTRLTPLEKHRSTTPNVAMETLQSKRIGELRGQAIQGGSERLNSPTVNSVLARNSQLPPITYDPSEGPVPAALAQKQTGRRWGSSRAATAQDKNSRVAVRDKDTEKFAVHAVELHRPSTTQAFRVGRRRAPQQGVCWAVVIVAAADCCSSVLSFKLAL